MADGSATGERSLVSRQAGRAGERPRVAVIGSGFGGLAAAIRLQASGIDTVLFEARDKPGGRAYVYEEAGFVSAFPPWC
ncbi:MAG TPA: FAD-dependent oxidoreductase [Polyangiaceae bacterium]|nr:FAD-dependent oxidoreductase [Polyangiaceae bacterium]